MHRFFHICCVCGILERLGAVCSCSGSLLPILSVNKTVSHRHIQAQSHFLTFRAVRAAESGCFSTLDSPSTELFTVFDLRRRPQPTIWLQIPRLRPAWRFDTRSLLHVCVCTSPLSQPSPSPTPRPTHTYTYHPPRAILSVWKFGLLSWNPTKHCHLLIVIISLACSLTKTLQHKHITSLW